VTCKRHRWVFQANVIMELPARAFHAVNKGAIRSGDVKIMGVNWDGVRIAYCTVCGKTTKDISVLCAPKKGT
jgi:hypothetical protein